MVATLAAPGAGAAPWLEEEHGSGDEPDPFETVGVDAPVETVGGRSTAQTQAQGGARANSSNLSCPAGMVLNGGLCKTPRTETVPVTLTCTQAGYELVSTEGELGTSHSCQKTVPARCTGGKVLHEGQCRTRTVTETTLFEAARWTCSEGTLITTFVDPGYSRTCRVTLNPPTCTGTLSYRTDPSAGCYRSETYRETRAYDWTCSEGTLITTFLDPGYSRTCRVTLNPPTCPSGQSYRTSPSAGCYRSETYRRTAAYEYACPSGYTLTNAGEGEYCTKTVSPYCTGSLTYRTSPSTGCYRSETYYRTRAYTYRCPSGYTLQTDGIGWTCTRTVSPYCTGGQTYRTSPSAGCYRSESYYRTRSYRYSCPSGYTLSGSGSSRRCSKTETYRKRVCVFDPVLGRNQCWWENRTRTVTKAVIRSCPSGYSPNGSNCRANSASTRWVKTSRQPLTTRTANATRSCPSGFSPNGSNCRANSASTRWVRTSTQPLTERTASATRSCPSGFSPNGANCRANTDSTRWVATDSTPTRYRTAAAPTRSCPSGFSANGANCRADTDSTRWVVTETAPTRYRTGTAPTRSCRDGYTWQSARSRCETTTETITYSNPTAPITRVVGNAPVTSCRAGYTAAGGGRCSRTVYGAPTAAPTVTGCVHALGTLSVSSVSRAATLGAGCVSLQRGDAQNVHYARRFTLRTASAAEATFTASSAAADTYLYVLRGSGQTATVVASDDDSGTGTDAQVTNVALAARTTYTVEVTTSASGRTGAFTLTGTITDPLVRISGLADGTGYGAAGASVTASDGFTVDPAAAACTATSPAEGVTPRVVVGDAANKRTVSVAATAPYSHSVTVRCTATGRTAAEQRITLAGKVAVTSLTVAAGAACSGPTAGRWRCRVTRGTPLTVTATAQGAHSGLDIAATAAGGATVGAPAKQPAAPAPGVGFTRTATVAVGCTAAGTVTVTATAASTSKTAPIDVTCVIPVPCDDALGSLATGTVTRTGTITNDASCTTSNRSSNSRLTYYTRRHTFTLAGSATVTIDIGNAASNSRRLDTYLILLRGHGASGSVVGRDDDGGPGYDSRLSNLRLAAGKYTIEATTFGQRRTGAYDLRVSTRLDTAVKSVTVASGRRCGPDPDGTPSGVDVALECTLPKGRTTTVNATAVANHATIAVAWSATGGAAVTARPLGSATQVLGPNNAATGDWTATGSAGLSCTADGTVTLTATAGASGRTDTHVTRLEVDCVDPVTVTGLDDITKSGTGTVTVAREFTVAPAAATCTASPSTASVAAGSAGARTVSARLAVPGSLRVTVTCTHDDRADAIEQITLAAAPPLEVQVSGPACTTAATVPAGADSAYACKLSDKHLLRLTATARAGDRRITLGWAAAAGATLERRIIHASAAFAGRRGVLTGRWQRTGTAPVRCTADSTVTLTVRAGIGVTAPTHTAKVSIDCQTQGTITGLADTTAYGRGSVRVADGFTVTPPTARCTATPDAATVSTVAAGRRTVALSLTAAPNQTVRQTVRVDCTPPGHAPVTASAVFTAQYTDNCNTDIGELQDGTITRTGTITVDSGCVSPQRHRNGGTDNRYYARRHTFTLANAGTVTIDIGNASSNSRRLDTYLLLLAGRSQNGTGTVLGRNDDGGPGYDSRLTNIRLAPGDYTIEATAYGARRTGNYNLRVRAELNVAISDLADGTRIGTGDAEDHFTVAPADARCTTNTGTVTEGTNGKRTLTVNFTRLGTTRATVTCTRTNYGTATGASTLRALAAVSDVTVTVRSGGECTLHGGTLDAGIDKQYNCTLTRNQTLTVGAEATGASSRMGLTWTAQNGTEVTSADDGLDASVVGSVVTFARNGTGEITCTSSAAVTLKARIGGVAHHTTKIVVTCQPPVAITNYVPGSRDGAGAMTGSFDVAPATATCRARHTAGITGQHVAPGTGTGASRTVAVTTTATGALDVEVRCSNTGYGTTTATARFVARDETACSTTLGTLWHGSTARTGTLSATSCTSKQRLSGSSATFRAHRYTFRLAAPGWVTIDLEATQSGSEALDTYLLLLAGHGSGGAERGRDNNSGTANNARIADKLLAAGTYTIEATTATAGATGGYRIRAQGDFAVRAPNQPARTLAKVGHQITRSWAHQPATATVAVQSVTPTGLDAMVATDDGTATLTATANRAGDYTVTVAYTAAGHTSTKTTVIDADCPPRHIETQTRTCTPLATALPAGCSPTPLHGWLIWGRKETLRRYGSYAVNAPGACASLSQNGNAVYYVFDTHTRLPVTLGVTDENGSVSSLAQSGGRPTITLWRSSGRGHLSFAGTATTTLSSAPTLAATIAAGTYVLEIAPSRDVLQPSWKMKVQSTIPTGQKQFEDVRRFGHLGAVPNQLTLNDFVATRANKHRDYPYLTWTSDQCSGSPDTRRFGIVDRHHEHSADYHTGLIAYRIVKVYYGCWRHDFNWRNLARIQHQVDPAIRSWNNDTKSEADRQLGADIRTVCDATLGGEAWAPARDSCYRRAAIYEFVVSSLPFSWQNVSSPIGPPQRTE